MSRSIGMYNDNIKKPMASIQISKSKDAKGMEVGETVSIHITGVIKAIQAPHEAIDYGPEGSKTKMCPGSIEMEIHSVKAMEAEEMEDEEESEE